MHTFFGLGVSVNFLMGGFHWEDILYERKFLGGGVNFSGEIIRWVNFLDFLYNFFLSYFLFADLILHVEILRVIVRGKFLPKLNCL